MKSDLLRAKDLLIEGGYTCVLCKGDKMMSSMERGVKPLLAWIDSEEALQGFSAADKVVGNAAAFCYVILGVNEVYAQVMSEAALSTLEKANIMASCDVVVTAIRNRANTGFCPMEGAVKGIEDPDEALMAIRNKIQSLSQNKTK